MLAPYSQVDHRPDDGGSKLHRTSVKFCQTTRRHIPEDILCSGCSTQFSKLRETLLGLQPVVQRAHGDG
jgi:hypothetical protein